MTICSLTAEDLSLRVGFSLKIYKDSKILRRKQGRSMSIIWKSSSEKGESHSKEWSLIDDATGLATCFPVLSDLP